MSSVSQKKSDLCIFGWITKATVRTWCHRRVRVWVGGDVGVGVCVWVGGVRVKGWKCVLNYQNVTTSMKRNDLLWVQSTLFPCPSQHQCIPRRDRWLPLACHSWCIDSATQLHAGSVEPKKIEHGWILLLAHQSQHRGISKVTSKLCNETVQWTFGFEDIHEGYIGKLVFFLKDS